MASESKPMDIEEEVPEIEDEVKKPEDEGQVAEREWEYQREPEAQDIEAPDIFASYRKETLPIFETRRKWNPFKRGKKGQKKIGKLTWEDDVKTIADHIKEQKEESSKPEFSVGEKHLMDHPNTKEYSFYKSLLGFHNKIRGDEQAEEEPIGAQPTGAGRRRTPAAPFKRGRGKKVGQQQSLVGGKKSPFGKRGSKGTTGRGAKQRQKPTSTPSANPSGGMAGLASQYQPKMQVKPNPAGLGQPFKQQVGNQKVPKRAPAKPVKDRSQGEAQAIKQPENAGSSGQALQSQDEKRKLPKRKPMGKKDWKKYQKKIQEQKRESEGRGSKHNPKPASGETYRKQQAAEAAAKRKKIKIPSSGSGAPKIAAIKAWYSEIYGI